MAVENETPSDDLRSLLSAAHDESIAAATDAPEAKVEPKAVEAEPKTADVEPKASDDRPRGPDGKFLKKDDADPASQEASQDTAKAKDEPKADEVKAKDEPKADADKDKEPKADPNSKEPPANWAASDKAMFKLQSPEAQDFLLRRHKAMEADYTKKLGEITGLKKEFGPIEEMFRPHLDTLKSKGLTPASTIRAWANVETALVQGKGVDVIAGIVKGYNIDKAQLARALGFTSTPMGQTFTEVKTEAGQTIDPNSQTRQPISISDIPELAALKAQIDKLTSDQTSAARTAQQAAADKVDQEIQTFKSASENGELLHPYFDEVEPAMIALAQSYAASKQQIPALKELYEQAVWANPSTRTAILATQKAAEEKRLADEARAKAASARKAASSVTGAPGSGQTTKPIRGELSLREQLEEAAADQAA